MYLLLFIVVAAVRDYGTEELALNHLLAQSAPNGNPRLIGLDVGTSSGSVGVGPSESMPIDGDTLGGFEHEIQRDVEMEDELTGDLQQEDAFSDYDVELTRESEAIEEYSALVLV